MLLLLYLKQNYALFELPGNILLVRSKSQQRQKQGLPTHLGTAMRLGLKIILNLKSKLIDIISVVNKAMTFILVQY